MASCASAALAQAAAPQQSALRAHGDGAAHILEIAWVLIAGGGLIFIAVMALGVVALSGPASLRTRLAQRGWVVGAGVVFPLVVLTVLLVYTFAVAASMQRAQAQPAATRIQVTGELWWWRVRYLGPDGATLLETANELRIPTGEPVDVELVSNDVIHSFWVPSLAGKVDMLPGSTNRLRLRARGPGVFRGQCAEYCGLQHAKMALHVIAHAPAEHAAWMEANRSPAALPREPLAQQGRVLFEQARCGVCHTVRGTPATGSIGPDLTHVGSRLTLAAGTLPNGQGPLAAWIADPQHIKPGSRMPGYTRFSGEELRALATYLEGLR
ncbi:c-type cytochrome [Ramlibacter henchirensis]|uniref:C-type cytochrome n=2 Tax=Ramlibacter henchirensis TaxID=204072 RepID=A0A4Z0C9C7_9BURK|nr:c-type cytochrome [Ramlibacter henchirensis]